MRHIKIATETKRTTIDREDRKRIIASWKMLTLQRALAIKKFSDLKKLNKQQ
jgi:hypothetical protein